jgi:hypothetical protein
LIAIYFIYSFHFFLFFYLFFFFFYFFSFFICRLSKALGPSTTFLANQRNTTLLANQSCHLFVYCDKVGSQGLTCSSTFFKLKVNYGTLFASKRQETEMRSLPFPPRGLVAW